MKKLLKSLVAVMLISMMALSLASCGANPNKVGDELTSMGYTVTVMDQDDVAAMGGSSEGVSSMVVAVKNLKTVTIVWCEKKADAEATEASLQAVAALAGYKVELKGKVLVYGDPVAVDDALSVL